MPPGNWYGKLKKINKLEDLSLDGRIIWKRIFPEKGWEGQDCINLAQDNEEKRICLRKEIDFRVP